MLVPDDRLGDAFLELIRTPDLPELGPSARTRRLPLDELNGALERFFIDHRIPSPLTRSLSSAALLWHDYLDESHSLSQEIHSADGSFLHGIMHRREPDYGNAKYWFRRVGDHPAYLRIARRGSLLPGGKDDLALSTRLVPRGRWDPFAFVDACEMAAASGMSDDPSVRTLRAIQAIEFKALVAHLFSCSGAWSGS